MVSLNTKAVVELYPSSEEANGVPEEIRKDDPAQPAEHPVAKPRQGGGLARSVVVGYGRGKLRLAHRLARARHSEPGVVRLLE